MNLIHNIKLAIIFFLSLLLISSCKTNTNESDASPQGPNIGGLGMPRGLISSSEGHTDGYVFFNPLLSSTTYLVNSAGEVVHTWDSEYGPSGCTYLKDNGNLVRGGRDPENTVFDGGGQGGVIQEFDWDGNIVWEYKYSDDQHMTHHDIALMPNGNILALSWESKSPEEAITAGMKEDFIPKAGIWPDMIVELKPKGANEADIIWEWHIWDHMIQDHDEFKSNYGNPAEHPELMNINLGEPLPELKTKEELDEARARNNANTNDTPENQGADMYHLNAIDYNAELDQIVVSSPALNEIFIIDHSTTTAEAAGHTGGKWGKGGDILYRWGNPQNYSRGDSSTHILGGQHDVRWIGKGYPGEGNLMVFNNFIPLPKGGYSAVMEITPPLTESGYSINNDEAFGPTAPSWIYMAKDTASFFGPFISGAHRMSNGNTFINEGPKGRYFEVTPNGDILWDYWTPYSGDARMPDGTFPQPVGPFIYATFRATHIPKDHPAVANRTLSALNPQPDIHKE